MKNVTTWFLHSMDMSEQLAAALATLQGVSRGIPARIYAFALSVIAIASGAMAWHFDYAATIEVSRLLAFNLASSLSDVIPPLFVTTVLWACTIAPTAIEMFLPSLAKRSFFISLAFYCCLLFDMATDYPRVAGTVALYEPTGAAAGTGAMYEPMGAAAGTVAMYEPMGAAARWAAIAGLLLFASIGFELLFVVSAVGAVYLWLRG